MHAIITGTEGRHHRGHITQTHQDSKSCMTTSSNGNIFCVTGNLCGEFTGPRWIPRTKASDVTRCFGVFLDLHPNKRLSKQWWGWWFETPSRPLWRDCNWLDTKRLQFLAATKQLYEWFSPSVRPSVCLSVRLSVRHTFLTMFLSLYHHEISRSYYQWQKRCPCKRSRS